MRVSDIFGLGVSPPPSDAECDSIAMNADVRAACARLQDPTVWYSGPTDVTDYPIPPS